MHPQCLLLKELCTCTTSGGHIALVTPHLFPKVQAIIIQQWCSFSFLLSPDYYFPSYFLPPPNPRLQSAMESSAVNLLTAETFAENVQKTA